jgi:osmotically-inducible protein OsmY
MRQSSYSGLQDISCECDEAGVLLLQGQLPSFHYKQIAQEVILHLEGIVQVVNQIEVVEHLGAQES